MKQSANSAMQPRRLTQYSSGEDSGPEDIRLENNDLRLSGYLHHSLDLKGKKNVTQAVLRQSRHKRTVADYQYQIPSYFSRDVLPLDAENNSKCDFIKLKSLRSENNFLAKQGCRYSEHASNGVPSRTRQIPITSSVDMSREFKTTEEKGWFSLHYQKVSMILVAIVLLFFIGLGLMYLNVCFKDSHKISYENLGNVYPVCDYHSPNPVECIPESQLITTLSMLQVLSPKLKSLAIDSYCNSSKETTMSDSEALLFVAQNMHLDPLEVEEKLRNLKFLVLKNPHWDIKIVGDIIEDGHISGIDELMDHGRFLFKDPLLPFTCQLKLLAGKLLTWKSFGSTVALAVTAGLIAVWQYRRYSEQHRQDVYMLVNKIISSVRNHHRLSLLYDGDNLPFLPVDKCRSEIINPKHCKYLGSAWEEAVKFIEVHESRILTDVRKVDGKPTKVWQWLSVTPSPSDTIPYESNYKTHTAIEETAGTPAFSSFSRNLYTGSGNKNRRYKVWQGQAFDTIAGSPNSLPCSPTPCLKIRHMFDPDLEHGEDWPVLIQDSILEKCEDICVLHLYVECSSQEGCVFMKCSSPEEAGKAYRALHGWWFDTKLVTVKYLRTERYHERFPEAANASCPLRPSNNQRLSLQELWHFHLEST